MIHKIKLSRMWDWDDCDIYEIVLERCREKLIDRVDEKYEAWTVYSQDVLIDLYMKINK